MKIWTYISVTEEAEHRIVTLMEEASQLSGDEARLHQQWAYGAYLMWDSLTVGWQKDGDSERMQALTECH